MSSNKPTHQDTQAVFCFVAGIAAVLMGYSVYTHLKTLHDRNTSPKITPPKSGIKLEDSIPLKSLAYLTKSNNVNIQSSSIKIILERAMSGTYLPQIIAACGKDQPISIKSKALPSLQLLTRKENNKTALLEAGALRVLVDALKCTDPDMKEVTQRYVAVAICDLIQGSDIHKYSILDLGVLDPIKRILTSEEIRNNELKYWTLMILYQISLSDPLPKVLIEDGFVSLLARMARMTYGNTNMPKFCMQSLVRIAANIEVAEAKSVLTELLDYNIVDLISNCLRGDDVELIYWAAGLMHEFVLKDIAADKFREIKGIHTILAGLLSAEEMYISRVILRTIKFMAYGQDEFRHEMVRSGMVKKIMHCLSLDDEDVRYWAILCIHVVAGQIESHQDIITAPEFEVLLELALSTKIKVSIFVSDILSLICCISNNNTFMEPNLNLIVKTLNSLLIEGELDVQYNAAGAIFNAMTMTYAFANKIRDTCFETLVHMATSSTHERVQLTCTKGAIMIVIKNRFLTPQLNDQVTDTLIETVNTLSGLISPVFMVQEIIKASKNESSLTHTEGKYQEITALSTTVTGEEEDEEETENLLRETDYIDVSEQGTISNASRLDRVLKDRERSKLKRNKKKKMELLDVLTHDDVSYLFDPSLSSVERELLFTKFETPASARTQIIGAMTALNILLENDHIIGNYTTGDPFRNPILDVLDDIVIDIDDIGSSIYAGKKATEVPGRMKDMLATSMHSNGGVPLRPMSDTMKHLVQNLMHMILYPALEEWATQNTNRPPLQLMTESKALDVYNDVIQWMKTRSDPSTHDSLSDQQSSDSSDGFITVISRQRHKETLPSNSTRRYQTFDSSSDSENGDSDSESIPIQPHRTKRIDSAAERAGQTRRHGERIDVEEILPVAHSLEHNIGFSNRALSLLSSLTRYASVRSYLVEEANIIPVLIYLFENHHGLLDRVIRCLGGLFANETRNSIPESSFQVLSILLWRGMHISLLNSNPLFVFYSRLILSYCSRCVASEIKGNTYSIASSDVDVASRSKFCIINYEGGIQVRNDTWTFETVRAGSYAPAIIDEDEESVTHKYAFEVKLDSDGLMQVGWASEHFEFDPEGGRGVGDDAHSYGYDGYRAKIWHGRYSSPRTTYGSKWSKGDIITCTIDMDVGDIRYYKNGQDMGVAFHSVDTSCAWYPTLSLATGQQMKFMLGGTLDPLKHLKEGYTAVGALSLQSPVIMELPPPHFTRLSPKLDLDEADIANLANALERLTVNSPTIPQPTPFERGIEEPNLKPVDSAKQSKKPDIPSTCFSSENTQRKPQPMYFITQPDTQHSHITPSLYFEITISTTPKPNDSILFGYKSMSPGKSFYFTYTQSTCTLMVESDTSESLPLEINKGDIMGVIYVSETNTVGLTLNGSVKAIIHLKQGPETLPYLPFVTGDILGVVNYGDETFAWKSANSIHSKHQVASYLYRLLGNRLSSN